MPLHHDGTQTHEIREDPPNPDVYAVQQEPEPTPGYVPVCQVGPVNAIMMPARRMSAFTEVLDTNMRYVLNGPDAKRAWVQISADGDLLLSTTGNSGSGARVHFGAAGQGSPVVIPTTAPIYLAAVTGTVTVGILVGYWAD